MSMSMMSVGMSMSMSKVARGLRAAKARAEQRRRERRPAFVNEFTALAVRDREGRNALLRLLTSSMCHLNLDTLRYFLRRAADPRFRAQFGEGFLDSADHEGCNALHCAVVRSFFGMRCTAL